VTEAGIRGTRHTLSPCSCWLAAGRFARNLGPPGEVCQYMRGRRALIACLVSVTACTSGSLRPAGTTSRSPQRTTLSPTPVPSVRVTEGRRLHLAQVGGLFSVQEAFGSIWAAVMVGGNEKLLRADPATGEVRQTFPLAYFPAHEWGGGGLVAGDGAIWVADARAGLKKGIIERIDPATDAVDRIEVKGRGVEDLAFDSGRLWALVPQNTHGGADVVAIDPATATVLSSTPLHADWYGGLFPVAGTVWTVERRVKGSDVLGGRLVQIVPGRARPITLGGSFALPASDATSIWTPYFGDSQAMNLASGIARINPATGEVLSAWKTDAVGYDLAVGLDGGIWFLSGDHLKRLDPSTGTTDVGVSVPGGPIFIAPTRGGIWVGTYKGDLIRFDVNDVGA
jgi:hypothetical protein